MVEDVALEEDDEFLNTFLDPRNNREPDPGQWLQPVDDVNGETSVIQLLVRFSAR